jgi:hypothetical protein
MVVSASAEFTPVRRLVEFGGEVYATPKQSTIRRFSRSSANVRDDLFGMALGD